MKRADMLARLDVGASIKKLRKEKGLSQDELAKGICDRANIAKLENGHSKTPSFNLVLLICEKFDISIEEFLNYSLKDNYSLNRDLILEYLMDNSLSKLKNYLSNIDFNSLPSKDKKYYTYLESLSLFDTNAIIAKEKLLSILMNHKPYTSYDIVELLSYHELVKRNLITINKDVMTKVYLTNINKFNDKSYPLEGLYLINDLINSNLDNENSKLFLQKEIEFINCHQCYKYLNHYYKSKIHIYKDDIKLTKELENKLNAITSETKQCR